MATVTGLQENLVKNRTVLRRMVTKTMKEFERLVSTKSNVEEIKVVIRQLEDKASRLFSLDEEVLKESEWEEEDLFKSEEYRDLYHRCMTKYETILKEEIESVRTRSVDESYSTINRSNLKLPEIQLIKFDGEPQNWLAFWGQFERIHTNNNLTGSDKFQYLLTATVGKANDVIRSYPPSNDNYLKAVEHLRERYAREEFLIEYYVRQLISLVISQCSNKNNLSLSQLYDRLETHLRSLESLGVKDDKFGAVLYPLVESSLPLDILKNWQRFRSSKKVEDELNNDTNYNILQVLIQFLKREVDSEQRVNLARSSFRTEKEKGQREEVKSKEQSYNAPTVGSLINTGKKLHDTCIFCDRQNHRSQDCHMVSKKSIDERKNIIHNKRACFNCLRPGHRAKFCRVYLHCVICGKKHYPILCPDTKSPSRENKMETTEPKHDLSASNMFVENDSYKVILQTILVNIVHKNKIKTVRALFDSGSERSYLAKDIIKELKIEKLCSEKTVHCLFGGTVTPTTNHNVYDVMIKGINSNTKFNLRVLDQAKICSHVPTVKDEKLVRELSEKGIKLSDNGSRDEKIELLLGADIIGDLLTGQILKLKSGPTAIETELGWTLMGKLPGISTVMTTLSLRNGVNFFWDLENLGINDPIEIKSKEKAHEEAVDNFNRTVKRDSQGRYQVTLPWLEGHPKLQTNIDLAEKRLKSLTQKLVSKDIFNDYNNVLNLWKSENIIEECLVDNNGHYLPHQVVIKESSETTKLRPVFDASARDKNHNCLNNCLDTGPNMLELLTTVLIRFRLGKYGIISDIKKAFLQIGLQTEERDNLKFLWWENYPEKKLKAFRHCRVVFGVSPSPFLLNAVILYHLNSEEERYDDTVKKLKKAFYVDDCILSVDTIEEVNRFILEAEEVMGRAKFELRNWVTSYNNLENKNEHSVLGVMWNVQEDKLYCNTLNVTSWTGLVTKRSMLSLIQKLFDPLGFMSPVTIAPRIWLQCLSKMKLSWDDEIPLDLSNKFKQWVNQLEVAKEFKVNRWLVNELDVENFSLHCFTDASQEAYATCVYLRSEKNGKVCVQLIQAKNRVAPIKKSTIPRLELLGALIGTRLCHSVKQILDMQNIETYYWTDSMITLYWIKKQNKEQWNNFVGNRLKEICQYSKLENWNHVPSHQNPADLPSRGCTLSTLMSSEWLKGPEWLYLSQENWPQTKIICQENELAAERRKTVISAVTIEEGFNSDQFIKFSKYWKNVRVIAWCYRFYKNCRNKTDKILGELSVEEVNHAETYLIKQIQKENFSQNVWSKIVNLHPVEDEYGVLRVKTKLIYGEDNKNFKFPILLPSSSTHVKNLIYQLHCQNLHSGVSTTMVLLREKYWVLRSRKTVQQVLRRCGICKRMKVKNVQTNPAPLPLDRIHASTAFEATGIDLAGPLFTKDKQKAWIVLYTCAVYRAVHLELVTSLSTDAFIMSFRRFIARRGRIKTVYTDNGTNFTGTANHLKKIDWNKVQEYSSVRNITWKFNPPTASWWGGWWERIVRIIKEILKRNLGKSSLFIEELHTILCECESIINSRPLTYIYEDNEEFVPITPSMFLQASSEIEVPDLDFIDKNHLVKRIRNIQTIREHLRHRFKTEYLSQLIMNGRHKNGNLKVGDVVLIGSENVKRINWPLARITDIFPGRDENPRLAKLRLSNGGEMLRPFQRLYPLEVSAEDKPEVNAEDKPEVSVEDKPEQQLKKTRSGRVVKPKKMFDY